MVQQTNLVFGDENELKDYLEDKFESNGWDCLREVRPDRSQYKVDIILKHDFFGPIGMEVKYLKAGDSAGVIADAHKQVTNQYWDKKYFGEKILKWTVCIYERRLHGSDDNVDEWGRNMVGIRKRFTREFFCRYGIGVLRLGDFAEIDFNYSSNEHKIPCFPIIEPIPPIRYESTDLESLHESIRRKREMK